MKTFISLAHLCFARNVENISIILKFTPSFTEAAYNESCFFNEQCEHFHVQTECRDNRCICRFEMSPIINKDGAFECKGIYATLDTRKLSWQ